MLRRTSVLRRHVYRWRLARPSARPNARRARSSRGSLHPRQFRCRPNERQCKEWRDARPNLQIQRASSNLPFGFDRGGLRGRIEKPGHRALLDEVLEHLLVLQRIHRTPETFVPEGHKLVGFNQTTERCLDQLIAFAHVIEYLAAEDEEAAVDPEICVLACA